MLPYQLFNALHGNYDGLSAEHQHEELFTVQRSVMLRFFLGAFQPSVEHEGLEILSYHDTFFALFRLPNDGVKLLIRECF